MSEPVPLSMNRGWLPELRLPWLAMLRADHELLVAEWASATRALSEAVTAFAAEDATYREALHRAASAGEPLDGVPPPTPAPHRAACVRVLREREQAARAALGEFVERVLTVDCRRRLDDLTRVASKVYSQRGEDRRLGNAASVLHNLVVFPHNEVAAVRRFVTGEQVLPATLGFAAGVDRLEMA